MLDEAAMSLRSVLGRAPAPDRRGHAARSAAGADGLRRRNGAVMRVVGGSETSQQPVSRIAESFILVLFLIIIRVKTPRDDDKVQEDSQGAQRDRCLVDPHPVSDRPLPVGAKQTPIRCEWHKR